MWYQRPLFAILFAGVLPFGVVVIEFFFVVEAFWGWPIYNAYRYQLTTLFIISTIYFFYLFIYSYFVKLN